MSQPDPDPLVRDILPVLRQCCSGAYGSALGGSYAKHRSDSFSDIDLYLFSSAALPARQRNALVRDAFGNAAEVSSWGVDEPFVHAGTDFFYQGQRIECWFRSIGHIESSIAMCLQGQFQREYVAWTVMGFFSYAVLSDLHSMRILEDPDGLLARWKQEVRTYPEPLRRTVLQRFLHEALLWPENPHYLSAIARGDLIYTTGIVQLVLHALIQVVFALNREYFPGEKNLAAAIAKLPLQPHEFSTRLQELLGAPAGAQPREQQRALTTLVAEMEQLVRAHGGDGA